MTTPAVYCVLNNHLDQGDLFVNGPYLTREAAQVACEQLAQAQLPPHDGDKALWEIERDDEPDRSNWIVLRSGEENYYEFTVFVMIPPMGGPE